MKKLIIKDVFKEDYITRAAGEKLRQTIEEAYQAGESIELDFLDMTIASTSFFDEGIAKLVDGGWNKKRLEQFVKFSNLNLRDREVMEKMCQFRGLT